MDQIIIIVLIIIVLLFLFNRVEGYHSVRHDGGHHHMRYGHDYDYDSMYPYGYYNYYSQVHPYYNRYGYYM